jgi:hypothetical protein
MLPAAAIAGMRKALELQLDAMAKGITHDRPDLLASIEDITDLMGYDMINRLESEFMLPEEIRARYHSDTAAYVVRPGEKQRNH